MVDELKVLEEQTLFDTDAQYIIPRYQRAYAWEDKEIIQLIDDIYSIESSENYYIGSLVVSKIDNTERYEVVDGQQRLTTLYLILQYLVAEDALEGQVGQTLSFDCRPNSNYTLFNLQRILKCLSDNTAFEEEERIELSILNGLKAIRQKFKIDSINKELFISNLEHVVIYRIMVPENTDLNRYFEIMNTRGEQLEQHDILKARLMKYLKTRKEQEFFAKVWNACSDMTGYLQMHFSTWERSSIFHSGWNDYPNDEWTEYDMYLGNQNEYDCDATIKEIIKPTFSIDIFDEFLDDNIHIRFESIIDFPYFLLHAIRVFVIRYGITLKKKFGELLDDKKLISDFDNIVNYGELDGKPIKGNEENFSKKFIIHLLQTRYLFDKFIIKREFSGEDKDGEWSLKELLTSGQASRKKAYYINTILSYSNEWEKTYAPRNKECLMIQSALRVSYTSPKVMHWITDVLTWLFEHNEYPKLIEVIENIAKRAVNENFLDDGNYKLGVQTPHIVFNYLDYLLWKNDKKTYNDFTFEFRNSVEHWYPQNPSDGSFDSWDNRDTFGNLCIISRSVNSKFSNLSPESKMKSYSKIVAKGSLKLRLMGNIIQNSSNVEWTEVQCQQHENEMIGILEHNCYSAL